MRLALSFFDGLYIDIGNRFRHTQCTSVSAKSWQKMGTIVAIYTIIQYVCTILAPGPPILVAAKHLALLVASSPRRCRRRIALENADQTVRRLAGRHGDVGDSPRG